MSVGRLRPPFSDDVQHYARLLARHARLELIEVREDESVARRLPERAFVSLLAVDGRTYDSVAFSRWLEERHQRTERGGSAARADRVDHGRSIVGAWTTTSPSASSTSTSTRR